MQPTDPALRSMLMKHEGVRAKPYRDTVGKLSIGVGRNLDDVGLRPDEIDYLLRNDTAQAINDARFLCDDFDALSPNRQRVLVSLCFNIGRSRAAGFRRLWAAIERGDFDAAAAELLDSKWARQVGKRAEELADMMRRG